MSVNMDFLSGSNSKERLRVPLRADLFTEREGAFGWQTERVTTGIQATEP